MLEQIAGGLALGGVYALIALGYTMVYGIIELINFAHGEIMMLGAFYVLAFSVSMSPDISNAFAIYTSIAFYFAVDSHLNKRFGLYGIAFAVILAFFFWFSSRKLFIAEITPLIAIPLAVIATAISGMALERIAYKPLRNSPRLAPLISAIGASLFYQNLAQIIFGTHRYSLPMAVKISNAKILGSNFALAPVLIILSAVVIMIALHLFIAKTRIGTAMRATAQDKYAASLMGINVNAVIAMTFAIGSALAAVGGLLFTIHQKTLWPYMGFMAGIKAFTAAVLGGIGSIPGAMLGGFILGIVESLGAGLFGEAGYKDAIAFVILIGVLLFKPTGILGKRSVIKV
ncbi:MAG: branched-chain amino acid ABC transporter permease [Candidatus Hydrogenedentes bacterium CG07_land_8_20_14_0_80_42_17]|nr:MAG: hypothetical protein AUJ18_07230 [Candidatus Hydrogenedentes bacterium CG1_02_42_14]PIU47615.1 MAG: branched-chain amino acid ABC transporter permease [Candidatus Hydrogenedentes bacterium CG07_land_8_20_14_0_80_42_17]